MLPEVRKLFKKNPLSGKEEYNDPGLGKKLKLGHLKSFEDADKDGPWYKQEIQEWIALVNGKAEIEFEEGILELVSGDTFRIEALQKHRIVSTSLDAVMIALHYD